jgi:hypothetical protein
MMGSSPPAPNTPTLAEAVEQLRALVALLAEMSPELREQLLTFKSSADRAAELHQREAALAVREARVARIEAAIGNLRDVVT